MSNDTAGEERTNNWKTILLIPHKMSNWYMPCKNLENIKYGHIDRVFTLREKLSTIYAKTTQQRKAKHWEIDSMTSLE